MRVSATGRLLEEARPLHWGARLGWASAARPRAALAVMLALVLAMVPGLFRLQLRTDGYALVPPDDPAIATDRAARRLFGLRDPLMVVIATTHPDGIFNPGTLGRLQRLTRDLAALPGIGPDVVQSLAPEPGGRFYPDGSRFRLLLDPPPRTRERLAEVREDVEAIDLLHGTLVSFDRRAAAILVGVPGPACPAGPRPPRSAPPGPPMGLLLGNPARPWTAPRSTTGSPPWPAGTR